MAGYYLNSLNWRKFTAMVERPTRAQLAVLADALDVERADWADALRKGDPILRWPAGAKGLVPIVADRLRRRDWYGDLSPRGRVVWAHAIGMAGSARKLGLDFRVHGSVYWEVIEFVGKRLGIRPNRPGKAAMSRFGTVPFRYHPPKRPAEDFDWAMHSMHPPAEVRRMRAELRLVAPALDAAADTDLRPEYSKRELRQLPERARERVAEDIRREFSEVLLPAVEWVTAKGRLLFVSVDT